MRRLVLLCGLLAGCDFNDAFLEWCRESAQCDGGQLDAGDSDAGTSDAGAPSDAGLPDAGLDGGVFDAGPTGPIAALELSLAGSSPQLVGSTSALQLLPLAADGGRLSTLGSTLTVAFDAGGVLTVLSGAQPVVSGPLGGSYAVDAVATDGGGERWYVPGVGSVSASLALEDGGVVSAPLVQRAFSANASWAGDGKTANVPWSCFADVVTLEGAQGARVDTTGVSFRLVVDGGAVLFAGSTCGGQGRTELELDGGLLTQLPFSVRYEGPAHITLVSSSPHVVATNRRETRTLQLEAWLGRDGGAVLGSCFPATLGWRVKAGEQFAGTELVVSANDPVPFLIDTQGGVQVRDACLAGDPIVDTVSIGSARLPVFLLFDGGGTLIVSSLDGGHRTLIPVAP